jgi:hypothetical protein
MSKSDIWYGFLEAGAHSSPVVRDTTLETNNRNTIYLYNHARARFLEYSREIVEAKLRELKPGDVSLKELNKAFNAARKSFGPGRTAKKWRDATPVANTGGSEKTEMPPDFDATLDFADEYI